MGVALVAMTHHESQGNESKADNITEFKIEGILNTLMLVPPVSIDL